jgi:hypothetical protein
MHGIILGEADIVEWDASANSVLQKMIRGLYYHHFKEILGDRTEITTEQIRNVPRGIIESWPFNSIGGDQFVYRYARANDVPLHSVWLLVFHGSLVVLGQTIPV